MLLRIALTINRRSSDLVAIGLSKSNFLALFSPAVYKILDSMGLTKQLSIHFFTDIPLTPAYRQAGYPSPPRGEGRWEVRTAGI